MAKFTIQQYKDFAEIIGKVGNWECLVDKNGIYQTWYIEELIKTTSILFKINNPNFDKDIFRKEVMKHIVKKGGEVNPKA